MATFSGVGKDYYMKRTILMEYGRVLLYNNGEGIFEIFLWNGERLFG